MWLSAIIPRLIIYQLLNTDHDDATPRIPLEYELG